MSPRGALVKRPLWTAWAVPEEAPGAGRCHPSPSTGPSSSEFPVLACFHFHSHSCCPRSPRSRGASCTPYLYPYCPLFVCRQSPYVFLNMVLLQWCTLEASAQGGLSAIRFSAPVRVQTLRVFPADARPFSQCPDIVRSVLLRMRIVVCPHSQS